MSTTTVVRVTKPYDIFIGRPSKWGNPYRLTDEAHREAVIQKYREWIMSQPHLLAALHELRGKRLGCYCSPKKCHGDVLAQLADG